MDDLLIKQTFFLFTFFSINSKSGSRNSRNISLDILFSNKVSSSSSWKKTHQYTNYQINKSYHFKTYYLINGKFIRTRTFSRRKEFLMVNYPIMMHTKINKKTIWMFLRTLIPNLSLTGVNNLFSSLLLIIFQIKKLKN